MTERLPLADQGARPRVGLLVNPVAGLGGRVGLKGTDGATVAIRALELGAVPQAATRAATALASLMECWPPERDLPLIVTVAGPMGADAIPLRVERLIVAEGPARDSIPADTDRLARVLADAGIDMLLFAGGDGTARDIYASVGDSIVALGVPAGVKMQSEVFALSPAAAGELSASWLAGRSRGVRSAEVLDLDEAAYRGGQVASRIFGVLRVPAGRQVQGRKSPSPVSDAAAMLGIATDVVESLENGRCYILGPGTTTRAIAERAGMPKTLLGTDAYLWSAEGGRLLIGDAGARELESAIEGRPSSIVVTPIGGQGFLFGRGNQSLSPSLIRAVGRGRLIVVATPAKLEALDGRPLLADTGDAALDAALAGYIQVVTGYHDRAVVAMAAA